MRHRVLIASGGLLLVAAAVCAFVMLWGTGLKPEAAIQDIPVNASGPVATPAEPLDVTVDPTAEKIVAGVKHIKTSQLGYKQRRAEFLAMARRGNEVSVGTLMALCNEHFEECAVVEALGKARVRDPEVRARVLDFLRKKISGGDVAVACAAVKSCGQIMGDDGVAELQRVVSTNRARLDGGGERVCRAVVEALGETDTPVAQAALIAELDRVAEPTWLPDYGSAVVAALAKRRTPEAREALIRYADGLARRMPAEDNPNGRKYIEEKIAEARAAAADEVGPEMRVAGEGK